MGKNICIIGGGISGLSLLHYLKASFPPSDAPTIILLEKESFPGGTIRTVCEDGVLFECGPNGFLSSKEAPFLLAQEIGLGEDIVFSSPQSTKRYISVGERLYEVPLGLMSFLKFLLLSWQEKACVFGEFFRRRGSDPNETVAAFGERRLGKTFVELFWDPMVSGVFGGDAQRLNLKEAFPRIFEIEQQYGSLFRGMIAFGLKRKEIKDMAKSNGPRFTTAPRGQLVSFRKGMGQLIEALFRRYQASIVLNCNAEAISQEGKGYQIQTNCGIFEADEIYLSVPAYAAADIVEAVSPPVAVALRQIEYAAIAVIGLLYSRSDFPLPPEGFGYLVPSKEDKAILGTLFSSSIFPDRCNQEDVLLRVMIGGSRHSNIIKCSKDELDYMAKTETKEIFQINALPKKVFSAIWPKAIPQYTVEYQRIKQKLLEETEHIRDYI